MFSKVENFTSNYCISPLIFIFYFYEAESHVFAFLSKVTLLVIPYTPPPQSRGCRLCHVLSDVILRVCLSYNVLDLALSSFLFIIT